MSKVNKNNLIVSDFIKSRNDLIKQKLIEIEALKKETVDTVINNVIEENSDFPIVELKSVCSNLTKQALIKVLDNRLIRESELSKPMMNLLYLVCTDISYYDKLKESFDTWSIQTKISFSLFNNGKSTNSSFDFIKQFLFENFNISPNTSTKDNLLFISNSYNKDNISFLFISIESIEEQEDYSKIADTLIKLSDLGYKPDYYLTGYHNFSIDYNKKTIRYGCNSFLITGTFKEAIISILKEIKRYSKELIGEDFDYNHD